MKAFILLLLALHHLLRVSVAFAGHYVSHRLAQWSIITSLQATTDDNSSLPPNFNPFYYQGRTQSSSPSIATRNVNLRTTAMKEVMNQMLLVAQQLELEADRQPGVEIDQSRLRAILQEHREMLLEPLDSDDTVLEPDSIYQPGLTRAERYAVYRSSLQERIRKASNPAVRRVLSNMLDFVSECE